MGDKVGASPAKVGLGPEEWLKMWESDFTQENSQQEDPSGGHHDHDHGDHGQEHEDEHSTTDDVDKHGNTLKVDSYLLRNIHSLTGGNTSEAVFVSLCGNTKDLEWLCSKGYSVVGAELSEKAVRQAFENACAGPIPYKVTTKGEVKIYSATDERELRVYVGNFFWDAISPAELGKFNCIWDGHGIVALPVSQQKPYADKLSKFLKPGGKILFSTVDYDITKLKEGPAPAPVPCSKLAEYFPTCTVRQLEDESIEHYTFGGLDHVTFPVNLVEAP